VAEEGKRIHRRLHGRDTPKMPCSHAGDSAQNTAKVPKITCSDAGESAQNAAAKVGPKIVFGLSLLHDKEGARREGGGEGQGGEVLINRSTYQVKPFYLSSETVIPIK
jgi:hypothetical protein